MARVGWVGAIGLIALLCGTASANRVLTQQIKEAQSGLLWKGSPLYAASEAAKGGFECGYSGRECNFVYSDKRGPDGECVPPVIPGYPGNPAPTIEQFCGYHQSIPPNYWDGVYRNVSHRCVWPPPPHQALTRPPSPLLLCSTRS